MFGNDKKVVHIIGGGTLSYVGPHLALSAPAYGGTARKLDKLCKNYSDKFNVALHLTRMAGGPKHLETVEDITVLFDSLAKDPSTKIIFMNAAICDFSMTIDGEPFGKRLSSSKSYHAKLTPFPKIIANLRKERKDIFLVGFKHTAGDSEQSQYVKGLDLLKRTHCNLVLANDVTTKLNMVISSEESKYHITTNRDEALEGLVEMAYLRSNLTFTHSTVIEGSPVAWNSPAIPDTLRKVVNYCVEKGAYKPLNGVTVGHFSYKIDDSNFLSSRRKTNFNDLDNVGLVKVSMEGPNNIIAYGSKPSAGAQSQRIIYHNHKEYDCIIHFHCERKLNSSVPVVSQRQYECGSHECGYNTSQGLQKFGNLSAVYLDNHGPNIVFNKNIDPQEVINFIEDNFHLEFKTGGPVSLESN